MSVPDHRHIPQQLFDTGEYDLTTHEGQGKYVDDCVAALHALDQRWGFLKKTGSGAQIHGHSEDGSLYLSDTPGQSQHVDFIANAGQSNAKPAWQVDLPRYSRSDWFPPSQHMPMEPDEPEPEPTPDPITPYPGDPVWDAVGVTLFADYAEAHQAPNPQMGRWFGRTIWDATEGDETGTVLTVDASIAKHRNEWREVLGLPLI